MCSEWRKVRLGEIADINGSTYSPREGWAFINYLDTGNITENHISEIQCLESVYIQPPFMVNYGMKGG